MFIIKDYRKEEPYQVYHDAIEFGHEQAKFYPEAPCNNPDYWIAWYAARRTASALLAEAHEMGLSADQWERLRKIAALVATD